MQNQSITLHSERKAHLTTSEAAQRLQRAPITLQKWRALGLGPRFFHQGRRVYYSLSDLKAFERQYAEKLIEEILETNRPITKTKAMAKLLGVSICTSVSTKGGAFVGPRLPKWRRNQVTC